MAEASKAIRTPRSEEEIAGLLREAERTHHLFRYMVEGQSVWQLLRFEVATQLQGISLSRQPVPRRRLVKSLFRTARQWLLLRPAQVLCKSYDSAHRRKTDNGYEDIYFDALAGEIDGLKKMSFCDAVGFEHNLAAAARPPILDETGIVVLSALLGRLAPVRSGEAEFMDLAEKINLAFGLPHYSAKRLRRHFSVYKWRTKLFESVLRRIRPRVVLCPDNGQFALLRACRKTGTPFIELQHGLFTQAHPNALPGGLDPEEKRGVLLPDALALYGGFARDALAGTMLEEQGLLKIVGAPFVDEAIDAAEENTEPRIIVTTQGIARDRLLEFLSRFLTACQEPFRLLVKLHPAYDSDFRRYADTIGVDPRVTIEPGTSDRQTHVLIAEADLHLSISSACHYDALAVGTPTGILMLETHGSVLGLLNFEGVRLIKGPAALAAIVCAHDWGVVPETTSRYICERGFNNHMKTLIGETGPSTTT
jgi:hypothetical protein